MANRIVHVNVFVTLGSAEEDLGDVALHVTKQVQDLVQAHMPELVPAKYPGTRVGVMKVLGTMMDVELE